jgi:hypothetical protein
MFDALIRFCFPDPRYALLAIAATTVPSPFVPDMAQRLAPIGMFAIVCSLRRKQETGGWLIFFYYQIYAGAVLMVTRSFDRYLPRPWNNETHHLLFIIAVIPRRIGFLIVVAVATALLKQRDVTRLQTLRLVLGIEVFLCLVSLVIDFFQYPSVLAFNLMQVIVLSLWLTHFYVSERVRHVFVAHDWPGSS